MGQRAYPSPSSGRVGWGCFHGSEHMERPHPDPPRKRLSDSHILEPQRGAELDTPEVIQPTAHDLWAELAIIAGPSAEASNDPGREGEGSFGMRIFLARSLAFETSRKSFENRLIVGFEGVGQRPVGCAIASPDELHDGDGCHRSGGHELDHDLWLADISSLDVEARGLEGAEELFDGPAH